MNSRSLIPLVLILLAAALAPAASAASTPIAGQAPRADAPAPADAVRQLLDSTRGQKARTGLGLPHYKGLLGKRWESTVKKADSVFASQLAKPAAGGLRRAAAAVAEPDYFGDDPLKAADSLKGIKGKQTRKLKIQTALDSMCPTHNPGVDQHGYFEIVGRARGELVVTTVERIGHYDVTTSVIFDVRFEVHSQTGEASLSGIFGDGGTVAITRSQQARDRRTGKTRKTGPTQRFKDALSPLLILEGGFSEFVEQQDKDEAPAPRRPLRSGVWNDLAQRFVAVVYVAIERDFAAAEKHFQTPNTCVDMSIEAPEYLAPGGKVGLHGVPHLKQGSATVDQMIHGEKILADPVNFQGQWWRTLATPEDPTFAAGEDWIEFEAPGHVWPASSPVGVKLILHSGAGVAEAAVTFKPIEDTLYFRVLEVSGSVDASDVKTTSGQCTFTGGPQHIEIGNPATPGASPNGELRDPVGHIWTPITYRTGAYSTLHSCPSSEKPCDFAPESLPNQNLGMSVRETGDGKVEASWSFVHVQLGHSGCGLQVPDLYVDRELLKSTHPLGDFQGNQPFVIETQGSQSYSVTQGISTMTGKLRWNFRMVLQRVREDGSAL
jgi:hypothetical protein